MTRAAGHKPSFIPILLKIPCSNPPLSFSLDSSRGSEPLANPSPSVKGGWLGTSVGNAVSDPRVTVGGQERSVDARYRQVAVLVGRRESGK